MKRGKLYQFEGTQATIGEIRLQVTCLSFDCIRRHLEAGRNTRQAMLVYNSNAARSRGGRKGRIAQGAGGCYFNGTRA